MNSLRRCAALIAAYAVALQLVLSAFTAVASLEAGFAICRGERPIPAGDVTHDLCAACVAHCAGASAPAPGAAMVRPSDAAPVDSPFAIMVALRTAARAGAHSPRGPPAG